MDIEAVKVRLESPDTSERIAALRELELDSRSSELAASGAWGLMSEFARRRSMERLPGQCSLSADLAFVLGTLAHRDPRWSDTVVSMDLAGAQLHHAVLPRWRATGVNLEGADLSDALLAGANFYNGVLTGARLERAILAGASLDLANLNDANLSGADLRGAYLSQAGLLRANLRGCDLSGANLLDAALEGADFTGAKIVDAELTEGGFAYAIASGADWA